MNKPRYQAPAPAGGYKAWKTKEPEKKELNIASFSDFPDLVSGTPKKSVFEGTSLAMKLKDAIAAEEEEAIQRRLKKGDTPEMILREGCVALPLKGTKKGPIEPFVVPWWVTENTKPILVPAFRHKTLRQVAEERRLKRYSIDPRMTMLYDSPVDDDDRVSLPSMPDAHSEADYDQEYQATDLYEETLVANHD